jgi:hypothetical protein
MCIEKESKVSRGQQPAMMEPLASFIANWADDVLDIYHWYALHIAVSDVQVQKLYLRRLVHTRKKLFRYSEQCLGVV